LKTISIFAGLYGEKFQEEANGVWEGFKGAEGGTGADTINKAQIANGMTEF